MRYPLPHPVHGVFLPRRSLFVDVVLSSRERPDERLRSRQGRWTASPAARVRAAFIICKFRGTKSRSGGIEGAVPVKSKVRATLVENRKVARYRSMGGSRAERRMLQDWGAPSLLSFRGRESTFQRRGNR